MKKRIPVPDTGGRLADVYERHGDGRPVIRVEFTHNRQGAHTVEHPDVVEVHDFDKDHDAFRYFSRVMWAMGAGVKRMEWHEIPISELLREARHRQTERVIGPKVEAFMAGGNG